MRSTPDMPPVAMAGAEPLATATARAVPGRRHSATASGSHATAGTGPGQGAPGRGDGDVEGVEAGDLGLPLRPDGGILRALGEAGGAPEHLKRHGGAPPGGAGR